MSADRNELARSIAQQAQLVRVSAKNVEHYADGLRRLLDLYWSEVPANMFKPSGKWMYEVKLDYRNPPECYTGPHDNALRALAQATESGTSGCIFSAPPPGWHLVVPEPPEGFPVMVTGGAS